LGTRCGASEGLVEIARAFELTWIASGKATTDGKEPKRRIEETRCDPGRGVAIYFAPVRVGLPGPCVLARLIHAELEFLASLIHPC
jgi:hypothetical protein